MTAFPRNVWYMAGWGHEVGRSLFRRRLFDRAIVLFREQGGTVRAISDRCPHRFAPLGLGELCEEVVVCPYHGLSFDGLGQCVKNPYSDRIPVGARVDAWTCVERHGIVWLWGGDHESADALSIPDFSMVEDNVTTRVVRGYTLLEAPYEFGTDNLMDLSHIEFVHKGSFAGNGVIFAGTHSIVDDGDSLHSNWWMPDVVAPPHTVGVYPPEMRTDHWLDMRWNAPASMKLEIGACPVCGERSGGLVAQQAHILTPAGPETTHYFWATTRNHDLESAETDLFLKQLFAQAFEEEDKPIIKAAYENLEGMDFWSAKPLSLGLDGGGTRARRKVEALVRAEAVQAP